MYVEHLTQYQPDDSYYHLQPWAGASLRRMLIPGKKTHGGKKLGFETRGLMCESTIYWLYDISKLLHLSLSHLRERPKWLSEYRWGCAGKHNSKHWAIGSIE